MTLSAIAAVSTGVIGSRSSRFRPSASRIIGAEPTFTCRSDPLPSINCRSHPSNSATAASLSSTRSTSDDEWLGVRDDALHIPHRSRRGPTSALLRGGAAHHGPAHGAVIGEGHERLQPKARPGPLEHPLEEAPVDRADEVAVVVEEVPEGTTSKPDLDGPIAAPAESRVEARFRQRLPAG